MKVLGVKIDKVTKKQALEKVGEFLNSQGQHKIFTPNPEMLVDAQKDENFKNILNSGDLNICDGFGIQLLSRVIPTKSGDKRDLSELPSDGVPKSDVNQNTNSPKDPSSRSSSFRITRLSGVDFMLDVCALAEETWRSVYLLGSGSDEVLKKTKSVLEKSFPKLKVVGINKGPKIERLEDYKINYSEENNNDLIADIVMSSPDILLVAFGHPKQEKWIDKNLKQLPSVKVAMGVGGSFDFISGKVKRAPKFLQKIGLEWLFRLIMQPKRIKRIFKATIIFIYYNLKREKPTAREPRA